jgi:hypothetical protein
VFLPGVVAAAFAGWGALDVALGVLELPWLISIPLAFSAAALVAAGALAWFMATAPSAMRLLTCCAWALAAGLVFLTGVRELPVYKATDAARLADGTPIGGSIVRVERRWPLAADLLHVLRGNGRVSRGTVLAIEGGRPVTYLRGN